MASGYHIGQHKIQTILSPNHGTSKLCIETFARKKCINYSVVNNASLFEKWHRFLFDLMTFYFYYSKYHMLQSFLCVSFSFEESDYILQYSQKRCYILNEYVNEIHMHHVLGIAGQECQSLNSELRLKILININKLGDRLAQPREVQARFF